MSEDKSLDEVKYDDIKLDESEKGMLFDNDDSTQTNAQEGKSSDQEESVESPTSDDSVGVESSEEDSSDDTEEAIYTLDGEDYTQSDLLDAIKDSTNRKEWQTSNTQNAQEVADRRRELEPLMQLVTKLEGNREFQGVLADAIEEEMGKDARSDFENAINVDPEKIPNPYKEELDQVTSQLEEIQAEQAIKDFKSDLKSEYRLKNAEVEKVYEHAVDVFDKTGRILSLEEAYKQTEMYENRIKQQALKEAGLNKKPKPPTTAKKSRGATDFKEKPKENKYENISAEGFGLFE